MVRVERMKLFEQQMLLDVALDERLLRVEVIETREEEQNKMRIFDDFLDIQ